MPPSLPNSITRTPIHRPTPRAVLGPTNTGKTFFAIEQLLSHPTGMIGLPLRLLAREVYDKLCARRPAREIALVTGEEKITPKDAKYWVCTVEAMPLERSVAFVAIDEVQLAADAERGRIFTERLLHARGTAQTLFLGADTMRPVLKSLFPDISFVARERLSILTNMGSKKVTRLPRRSAVVGFSADTVYAVAELLRRQRGGAAVVLGALSPRTRNAQAALYQNGDVDFLVATDAIGMGLNMDIDHVAFAARRKFDGRRPRDLRADELAQIAGRAGRHLRDGTFGVTADCKPLDDEAIEAIENHRFEPIRALQWRSAKLDFSSLAALRHSLNTTPNRPELVRARPGDDEDTLERVLTSEDMRERTRGGAALRLLWDVCQLPDFTKLAFDEHAQLVTKIYSQLLDHGKIAENWFEGRVRRLDRDDGDIDVLSTRIAHVRTWTYLANRSGWLENAAYWQEETRRIEDALSDALHDKLTQRFVDRRTAILLKKLHDDAPLLAGVTDDGDVIVEGQFVGRLIGFEFILDPRAKGAEAKRVRAAADKALTPVIAARAAALANADSKDLTLREDGKIWWRNSPVAHLEKGPTPLRPRILVRGLTDLTPSLRGRIEERLKDWFAARVELLLSPLLHLGQAAQAGEQSPLNPTARGIAYRLVENFGAMSRVHFGDELKQLGQDERGKLRKLGMRFGEYTLFLPALLKPAPANLLTQLWALWTDRNPKEFAPPKAGLVSIPVDENIPHAYYYACGYRPSGTRAVRIDMLERLAGQIRNDRQQALKEGFEATSQMMSLVGCSGEDFESILKSLGYKNQTVTKTRREWQAERQKKAPTPAPQQEAPAKAEQEQPEQSATQPVTDQATDTPQLSASAENPEPEKESQDQQATSIIEGDAAEVAPTASASASTEDSQPQPTMASADVEEASDNKADSSDASEAPGTDETAHQASISEDPDEAISLTLWRFAPRRSPPKRPERKPGAGQDQTGQRQPHSRKARGKAGQGQPGHYNKGGKGAKRHDSPYKGNPKSAPKKGAEGHAPRHRKVADPDSPFAVLASLKGGDQPKSD